MMKKLVALLMALALLCTTIGAFADTTDHSACTNNHKSTDAAKVADNKEATCGEDGHEWWWCDEHGYYEVILPATGEHTEGDWETVTDATDKTPGKKVIKCTVCGETLKEQVIAPLCFVGSNPDDYNFNAIVPIPVAPGNDLGLHEEGYALKANPDVTKLNCKAQKFGYYCIDCKSVVTVELKSGEHTADVEGGKTVVVAKKAATCTEDGFYTYKGCSVCGDKDVEWTVVVTKTGHKYDATKPVRVEKATCTTDGYDVFVCDVCGEEVKVKVADKKGHTPSAEAQDYIVPATCTTAGKYSKALVCDVCGAIIEGSEDNYEVDTIDVLKHQELLDSYQEDYEAFYTENDDGTVVVSAIIEALGAGETLQEKDDVDTESIGVDDEGNPIITGIYGQLKIVYTPATCTEKGHVSVTCIECGAAIEKDLTPLGHYYTPVAFQEALGEYDCTKGANVLVKCARYETCGYVFNVELPACKDHNFVEEDWAIVGYEQKLANGVVVKYDDTEFGKIIPCADYYEVYECQNSFCTKTYKKLVKGNGEHKPNVDKECASVPATCTTDGILYYECMYCAYPQVETIVAEGHEWVNGKAITPATCQQPGTREIYCQVCAKWETNDKGEQVLVQSVAEETGIKTKEIPTIDHNWVHVDIKPDCINKVVGGSYDICSMCNEKKNVVVDEGHQIEPGTLHVTKAATCTETGLQDFTCSICHRTFEDQVIPKKGHSYQQIGGKVVDDVDVIKAHTVCNADCKPAGCTTDATHTLTCDVCGEKLIWSDEGTAIGHHDIYEKDGSLTTTFVVMTIPTCETVGDAVYNCTVCKELHHYELAKLPHNLVPEYDKDNRVYQFVCKPIYNIAVSTATKDGVDVLTELVNKAYSKDPKVAAAVIDRITRMVPAGDKIGTFGAADHIVEVPVQKTEFVLSKLSGTRGKVEAKYDNMLVLEKAYVRVVWRYTLSNGDTISFVTTREITWDWANDYGTFKLTGLTVPEDAVCNFIYAEVVTDGDADELYAGEYTTYGSATL